MEIFMKNNQILVTFFSVLISTSSFAAGGLVSDSSGGFVKTTTGCLYFGNLSEVTQECPSAMTKKMPKKVMADSMAETKKTPVDAPKPIVKKIIGLDGVNFKTGSNELTGASLNTLDSVAQELKANPDTKIIVAGHTDNRGDTLNNLKLSQARAEAVRDHLIGQGVGAHQLVARGYGDTEAIASNDTPEGRAKNRRVELRILK